MVKKDIGGKIKRESARDRRRKRKSGRVEKEFKRITKEEQTRQPIPKPIEAESAKLAKPEEVSGVTTSGVTPEKPEEKGLLFDSKIADVLGSPKLTGTLIGVNLSLIPIGRIARLFGAGKVTRSLMGAKTTKDSATAITKIGQTHYGNGNVVRWNTNTQSLEQTGTWLQRLFTTTSRRTIIDPVTGISKTTIKVAESSAANSLKVAATSSAMIIGALGSYPLAAFLKEEALQSFGSGVTAAEIHGNEEILEQAQQELEDALNPGVWRQIMFAIPYSNVVSAVGSFVEGMWKRLEISRTILEDKRLAREQGTDEDSIWAERRKTRLADEKAEDKRWDDRRKEDRKEEEKAKKEGRKEDAKFWANKAIEDKKRQKEERETTAEFWLEYNKIKAEISNTGSGSETRTERSGLNFGL